MSEDRIKEQQQKVRDYYGIIFKGRGYINLDKYILEKFTALSVVDMAKETGISRSTIQSNCRKLGLYKLTEANKLSYGEEAKDLNYPWDAYIITNKGRLINKETGFLKKPFQKLGYLRYEIYRDGRYTSTSQHRLIAENFIPNPKNKPDVNHIDGCRSNNKIENLEWVTKKENISHARNILKKPGMYGEHNNFSRITEEQANSIIDSIEKGHSNKEIMLEYSYATKGILDGIRYQNNWSHLK